MTQKTHDIVVGDVITTYYHAGYFVAVEIVYREGMNNLIKYQQIAKVDGKKVKGKAIKSSDEGWCCKVTRSYINQLLKMEQQLLDKKKQDLDDLFTEFFIEE